MAYTSHQRWVMPFQLAVLEPDYDTPEDDYELVQAIVAGKVGLEPSGRSHDLDPLSLQPVRVRHAGAWETLLDYLDRNIGLLRPDKDIKPASPHATWHPSLRNQPPPAAVRTKPCDPPPELPPLTAIERAELRLLHEVVAEEEEPPSWIDAYIERRYGPQ